MAKIIPFHQNLDPDLKFPIKVGRIDQSLIASEEVKSGNVYLEKGDQDFGYYHIVTKHEILLKKLNTTAIGLAEWILSNFTAIYYEASNDTYLLVADVGKPKVLVLGFKTKKKANYYTIVTEGIRNKNRFKNQKPLWSRTLPPFETLTGLGRVFYAEAGSSRASHRSDIHPNKALDSTKLKQKLKLLWSRTPPPFNTLGNTGGTSCKHSTEAAQMLRCDMFPTEVQELLGINGIVDGIDFSQRPLSANPTAKIEKMLLNGIKAGNYIFDFIPVVDSSHLKNGNDVKSLIQEIRPILLNKIGKKIYNPSTGWTISIRKESVGKWFSTRLGDKKLKALLAIEDIVKVAFCSNANENNGIYNFVSLVQIENETYPFLFNVKESNGLFIYHSIVIPEDIFKLKKPGDLSGFLKLGSLSTFLHSGQNDNPTSTTNVNKNSPMKITTSNYKEVVSKIDITQLPPAVQSGIKTINQYTNGGSDFSLYSKNENVKRVIDKIFETIEIYAPKQAPAKKEKKGSVSPGAKKILEKAKAAPKSKNKVYIAKLRGKIALIDADLNKLYINRYFLTEQAAIQFTADNGLILTPNPAKQKVAAMKKAAPKPKAESEPKPKESKAKNRKKVEIIDLIIGKKYQSPNTGDIVTAKEIDIDNYNSPTLIDTKGALHATYFMYEVDGESYTKPKAAKTAAKPKESRSTKFVHKISPTVTFIKSYLALNGKEKTEAQILSFIKRLQRAILNKTISKSSEHAEIIEHIQEQLINTYHAMGDTVKINITAASIEKYAGIAFGETVKRSVTLLNAYIGIEGKQIDPGKASSLMLRMQKALDKKEITEKYVPAIEKAITNLQKFANKPGKLEISKVELNGLQGLGLI